MHIQTYKKILNTEFHKNQANKLQTYREMLILEKKTIEKSNNESNMKVAAKNQTTKLKSIQIIKLKSSQTIKLKSIQIIKIKEQSKNQTKEHSNNKLKNS